MKAGIQFNHTFEGAGRLEGIRHPIPFKWVCERGSGRVPRRLVV
jgi:hypothetical protein